MCVCCVLGSCDVILCFLQCCIVPLSTCWNCALSRSGGGTAYSLSQPAPHITSQSHRDIHTRLDYLLPLYNAQFNNRWTGGQSLSTFTLLIILSKVSVHIKMHTWQSEMLFLTEPGNKKAQNIRCKNIKKLNCVIFHNTSDVFCGPFEGTQPLQ